jgi:hypothetical protein
MYKSRVYLFLASAALAAGAGAAEFSSLEERMSQAEFHAAGLDKLKPEELKALNSWLREHNMASAPTYVTPSGQPVFYPSESERQVIETRIDGTFTGWYGHTVFTLENGQQWTQNESGSFGAGKYDHPAVKVKPMMFDSWLMYVEPCGCSVRVKRTK